MRVIRVRHKGQSFYASLGEGMVINLNRQQGSNEPIPLSEITLMPLVLPSKVICIDLNYRDAAIERELPLPERPAFVLRPNGSLLANGQSVPLPAGVHAVYPEAELAIVIGQPCRHIRPEDAARHIFGYTCANDITVRDHPDDPHQAAAKAFDATCPVGPWLETQLPDREELIVRCLVNGEVRQNGTMADMIFPPAELLSYLSQFMTMNPGDVILTGTPSGVAPAQAGDNVQVEIPGVGVLFNNLTQEAAALPPPVQ
ncbi:MAG: fumarylacetoacetate hydrolase family protein [Deltaproteobacteria bacterium]|jgi:2-keto-4-pentenoate hydratase/2-oxohepta-3-ene-1,7-dioic acid hydratase in catechol pathway|nr:fumarylacetoacetate hydrolase family protein [Deltaproteobacteria bacterium]